ncbi:unnamed protein product [Peronospora belbahrii]|uniref:Uncharacterized protein n=1 Tax=Peronospora belbahrii TaxID=622444 RepID=A0ABN8CZ55_9STRA|nr:unnamed protein product [Peronospora belbahrii]
MATPGGFSLGISPEEKLALPLDTLIQKTKNQKPKIKVNNTKIGKKKMTKKKQMVTLKNVQKKNMKKQTHKQQNVKKTVLVSVSKAARARTNAAVASAKRQTVINKRRPGLVMDEHKGKKKVPTVHVRPQKTSAAARKQLKKASKLTQRGLDVSNIINHFRSHPKKFDVPQGSNIRITINFKNVKPVVGGHK